MNYLDRLTERVIEARAFISDCLYERELYEADKNYYCFDINGCYYKRLSDPGFVEYISISLGCIDRGIYSKLFQNVEHIAMETEIRLANALGCPHDEPFKSFVDIYLEEVKNRERNDSTL